jgi:putative restriction endonuclease
MKRYGAGCAFCDLEVDALLDAAHIIPVSKDGSSDPRNGLVLCANHHRAFDAGLIRIHPETLEIVVDGDREELGVERKSLDGLDELPHEEALEWRWDEFQP